MCKTKARQRQNKRSACDTSGSVEQPALKRKDQRLTSESFQACAREPSEFEERLLEELGAASANSASLSEQPRKMIMTSVANELQKLIASAWKREDYIVDLDSYMREDLIAVELKEQAYLLQHGPKTESLMDQLIMPLYRTRCGALQAWCGAYRGLRQNLNEVWVIACQALEEKIVALLARSTDIDKYLSPQLWELLSAAQDAALNSLPEMAVSPEKLMQTLKDTKGENGAPFGRWPPSTLASWPNVFVRRLVCLELPGAFYADLPDRLVDLIDKVVQHRRSRARDGAEQPAMITASDITKILCDFSEDPWSNATKKRRFFDV